MTTYLPRRRSSYSEPITVNLRCVDYRRWSGGLGSCPGRQGAKLKGILSAVRTWILQQCIITVLTHRFKEELMTGVRCRFMEEVEAKDIDVYLNTMVIP